MTDSRHSESPSSPQNHSNLPGSGASNVMNLAGGNQYDSLSYLMQPATSRFIPPLNMAPIFPPGMKPATKPIGIASGTDLGPPMFQIPLNLGPPSSGLQKIQPVATSMISHASLPSMNPIFLSTAPTPQMYNPGHTSMTRPFVMPYPTHFSPALQPNLPAMDTAASKSATKLLPSSMPLSPSPPLQPSNKKHPSKSTSRPSSTLSTQKSIYSASESSSAFTSDTSVNSVVGNAAPSDNKGDTASKKNAVHDSQHVWGSGVPDDINSKSNNSVSHGPFHKTPANFGRSSNDNEDSRESRSDVCTSGVPASSSSDTSKFDPNQLLSFYNNVKKEPGMKQVNAVNKDRSMQDSKEIVRKTLGLPSDGSVSSSERTWSTEMTRSTNTSVSSEAPTPTQPTASTSVRNVSNVGRSLQASKQQQAYTTHDLSDDADKVGSKGVLHAQKPVVSTAVSSSSMSIAHPYYSKPTTANSPSTSVAALPVNSSKLQHPASYNMGTNSVGTPSTSSSSNSTSGPNLSFSSNAFSLPHSPRPSGGQGSAVLSPVSTPPRPSILRKRPNDKRSEPLSPSSSRQNPLSALSLPVDQMRSGSDSNLSSNEASEVLSPRKKPRKQNMMTTEDHFAGSIPECAMDGVTSLTCNNEDVPPSPDRSRSSSPVESCEGEQREKLAPVQPLLGEHRDFESNLRLLAEMKRPPVMGGYRVNTKATHNHFWRYSDFRVKEQSKPSVMSIAQKKNARLRVKGWRVGRVNEHMDTMVSNEEEVKETVSTALSCFRRLVDETANSPPSANHLSQSSSPVQNSSLVEVVQGNFDRSNNIVSCIRQTQGVLQKILNHKSKALELVQKCAPDTFNLETLANRTQNFTK